MLTLNWENDQNKIDISDEIIETINKCIEQTLLSEDFTDNAEVSLTFVDNVSIRELNNETRNIDKATDVLSFPLLEQEDDGTLVIYDEDMIDGRVLLGDIVISLERAKEQAESFGHSFLREVCFLAVHSCLHLLGYDHERSDAEEKIQFKKQEDILTSLGITR